MSVIGDNSALLQQARAYINRVADLAPAARFTIRYQGFGTGGTSGVAAADADAFLNRVGNDRYHQRVRIESITVEVNIPARTFGG